MKERKPAATKPLKRTTNPAVPNSRRNPRIAAPTAPASEPISKAARGEESPRRATEFAPTAKRRSPSTVKAKIDVGFGNSLWIRGQGASLSWENGQPLDCTGASEWSWSSGPTDEPITFKLLINDSVWAQGDNMTLGPGESIQVMPVF